MRLKSRNKRRDGVPFIFQLILTNSIPNRSEIDQIPFVAFLLLFLISLFFFSFAPLPFFTYRGVHDWNSRLTIVRVRERGGSSGEIVN